MAFLWLEPLICLFWNHNTDVQVEPDFIIISTYANSDILYI